MSESRKKIGLPSKRRMRHDRHFVDELTHRMGEGGLGRMVRTTSITSNQDQPRSTLGDLEDLVVVGELTLLVALVDGVLARVDDHMVGDERVRLHVLAEGVYVPRLSSLPRHLHPPRGVVVDGSETDGPHLLHPLHPAQPVVAHLPRQGGTGQSAGRDELAYDAVVLVEGEVSEVLNAGVAY